MTPTLARRMVEAVETALPTQTVKGPEAFFKVFAAVKAEYDDRIIYTERDDPNTSALLHMIDGSVVFLQMTPSGVTLGVGIPMSQTIH